MSKKFQAEILKDFSRISIEKFSTWKNIVEDSKSFLKCVKISNQFVQILVP